MIVRLVEFSHRRAGLVAVLALILAAAAAWFAATHAAMDSDTSKLVDPNLPWQKASADVDAQFPQDRSVLVTAVTGQTPEQAADAAADLTAALRRQPNLFSDVRQPGADPYFKREGLLFLPAPDVQNFADHLIAAQPFLGTLAADPSARGVLEAVDLLAIGALRGEAPADQIDPPLRILAASTESAAAGRSDPISWQTFFTGRAPDASDKRQLVLASPALNYGQLSAAAKAIAAIRTTARAAGLDSAKGITLGVTGQPALDSDQLSVLSEGAVTSTVLCLGMLCFWLIAGFRSWRPVAAILITLIAGLILCGAFAVGAMGPFNPVSVAFAPLFIGIAIDFGIQFSVRYSAERLAGDAAVASTRTAAAVGAPLVVAAVATACGFFAFAPTAYLGVRALGIIAGAGMIIACALNLTLLPAMLTLFRSGPRAEAAGFAWGRAADRFISRRRGAMLAGAILLAAAFAALLPRLRLDFNPVDLEDPHAESVRTLQDLMADPNTSPYEIEFLAAPGDVPAMVARLEQLPEVGRVLDVGRLVPKDQEPKLAILEDAAALLGPTLSPAAVKPPPNPDDVRAALRRCADDMAQAGAHGDAAAARLAAALRRVAAAGPAAQARLEENLGAGIARRLDDLRQVLRAGPVSLATLPADFRRDWVAPDGRWRVRVFPRGDLRANAALRRFARAVQAQVPQAVGSAVMVEEWTQLAPRAFVLAGLLALAAIAVLLGVVLRRLADVALVLLPLALAGLLTLGGAALLGLSINFANIITLPMILGIGVAFDIYFVMRHRAGEAGMLGSPTARGVVFSALTTGSAFGSLALSRSPGMAEMGKFLVLALAFILACTLFFLPALFRRRP